MTAPERRFGPLVARDGVTFRLWAPGARHVALVTHDSRPMQCDADGWCSIVAHDAGPGTRYRFRIDDEIEVAMSSWPTEPLQRVFMAGM